jgi:hypothetical protein
MNIISLIQQELNSAPNFNEDIDHYTSIQKEIRNFLIETLPNNYYYDLDIINDDIYKFKSYIFKIHQNNIIIKIIILGHFNDLDIHFCEVFKNDEHVDSYEKTLNLHKLQQLILNTFPSSRFAHRELSYIIRL